ncbi:MFS transporter [Herbaspirillum hiltneri N3]|uniref:MFS transporter n=1 Tax=Herbaspirillum hiltneri N3 TaxID=1262470 RepID=A0ABN4HZD7_9BURK|nr:MFS transporter [Herbaspirillum hiltneri]AKZ64039.1 MFS transporter [Herbaspirillum hiltneri N3]
MPSSTRFRYRIFFMVLLVAVINYIDRGALSYASQHILSEYGFDKKEWGAVLGYFGYGYMFGALVGGASGDRFGPRKVWLWAGVAWSVFEVATAFAGDLGLAFFGGSALAGFAMIRVMFGFCEGPAYSIINKTVSNWATSRERGFVVALGLLSTPLGAMLTAPVSVFLLTVTGSWRWMFVVLGVTGLLVLILFMKIFTNLPEQNPRVGALELAEIHAGRNPAQSAGRTATAGEASVSWKDFFRSRTLMCNTLGYFSFVYVNFLLLTWTPKYLQDQFHFSLSSLWYLGMIPWIGACFTVLLGGRFSDWMLRKTGNLVYARSWFAALSLLLTTATFLLVSQAESATAIILLMTIANAFNALPNSVYWAVVIDTSPSSTIGTFSGMMHFMANIGVVLAPTLTGYLVTAFGYPAMFIAAAVATCVGMAAMLLVRPGKL